MTDTEQTSGPLHTHLAKTWVVRMVLITVVLFAFGGWGFYDAAMKYPAKARDHAQGMQYEYLVTAEKVGMLLSAPIDDPVGELATLREREVLELSNLDRTKFNWLDALALPGLGMLKPEHTRMDDNPTGELQRLRELHETKQFAAALSAYDIMLQWAICVVCWGLGVVMLLLFVSVRSKSYKWEPATNTLTMPGGVVISPADLDPADPIDLAKWHKFVVFLRPREGHEKLDAPIKLDLFRYEPLEDWVRLLVKSADGEFEFPDEVKAREEAEAAAKAEADAGSEESSEGDKEV